MTITTQTGVSAILSRCEFNFQVLDSFLEMKQIP